MEKRCVVCNKTEGTKLCSRCRKVRYCGSECQKKDWPEHKIICPPPQTNIVEKQKQQQQQQPSSSSSSNLNLLDKFISYLKAEKNEEAIKILSQGINLKKLTTKNEEIIRNVFSKKNPNKELIKSIAQNGFNIDKKPPSQSGGLFGFMNFMMNEEGSCLNMICEKSSDLDLISFLLDYSDTKTYSPPNTLYESCAKNKTPNPDIFQLLLNKVPKPNFRNSDRRNPLQLLCDSSTGKFQENVKMMKDKAKCAEILIDHLKLSPNSSNDENMTVLLNACDNEEQNIYLIETLLKKKASPNMCDCEGYVPLHLKLDHVENPKFENRLFEKVRLLLEYGADPNLKNIQYVYDPLFTEQEIPMNICLARSEKLTLLFLAHKTDPDLIDGETFTSITNSALIAKGRLRVSESKDEAPKYLPSVVKLLENYKTGDLWSPSTHYAFPVSVKKRIFSFLICAKTKKKFFSSISIRHKIIKFFVAFELFDYHKKNKHTRGVHQAQILKWKNEGKQPKRMFANAYMHDFK